MDPTLMAAIYLFGGSFAPLGFMLCQGQILSISQNSALFNLIGTTFGGDGIQTFNLPDLQGRVPIHTGTGLGLSTYVAGQIGGMENYTLTTSNMPSHTHSINVSSAAATLATPTSSSFLGVPTLGTTPEKLYTSNSGTVNLNSTAIGFAGGSIGVSLIQPVLAANYIFAVEGTYPSS